MSDEKILSPEDYAEPVCPFCTDAYEKDPVRKIPVGRIEKKAEEYFSKNDYSAAEKHYLYWLAESIEGNDDEGKFYILNELMGLYRKTAQKEKALKKISETLALIDKLGSDGSISSATAYVNIGTVYKSFSLAEKSIEYFEKAEKIYEKELSDSDPRLGGLYNNYALALTDIRKYAEAEDKYGKALAVMEKTENGELERAITLLNLADLAVAEKGAERAAESTETLLKEAEKLLFSSNVPKNGYYAFVCEKCAPVFGYYGYFATEKELENIAKDIYERT